LPNSFSKLKIAKKNISDCTDPAAYRYSAFCLNLYTNTNLGVSDAEAAKNFCQSKLGTNGQVAIYKNGELNNIRDFTMCYYRYTQITPIKIYLSI
jgi:hypothetical protein